MARYNAGRGEHRREAAARGAARLLRGRRPRRADRRAGARAARRAGLRAQGDRPQQARRRAAARARRDLRRGADRGARGRRRACSPRTASRRACTRAPRQRGLQTIDATCPLVTKVHREAIKFAADGYTIVLVGHAGHEEVEGTMGEAPEQIVLVQNEEDVDALEVDDPERIAYITQTTLSVDETAAIIDAPARALPDDRRAAHRRHLLRDDQPPGGGQAAGRAVRPGARDRLAELLELEPARRGRARLRHRGAPDRQRGRGPARRGWRASAWSASPPARARPSSSCSGSSTSSARAASSDVSELEVVKEDVRFMLPKLIRQAAAAAPERRSGPAAARRRDPPPARREPGMRTLVVSDLHLGSARGLDLLRRRASCAPRCSSGSPTSIGSCCSATCSSCATARCARRWRRRARSSRARRARSAGRELVLVAGNHDHALVARGSRARGATPSPGRSASSSCIEPRRGLAGARADRRVGGAGADARRLPGPLAARGRLRDPRPLPRPPPHRADARAPAVGAMSRLLGRPAAGFASVEDYEAGRAGLRLARRRRPRRSHRRGLNGMATVAAWRALGGGSSDADAAEVSARRRDPARRGCSARCAGARSCAGFPLAVAALNRAGMGPLHADISGTALRRAGLRRWGRSPRGSGSATPRRLRPHPSHRPARRRRRHEWRGPAARGSQLRQLGLRDDFLDSAGPSNPYWPGGAVLVEDDPAHPPRRCACSATAPASSSRRRRSAVARAEGLEHPARFGQPAALLHRPAAVGARVDEHGAQPAGPWSALAISSSFSSARAASEGSNAGADEVAHCPPPTLTAQKPISRDAHVVPPAIPFRRGIPGTSAMPSPGLRSFAYGCRYQPSISPRSCGWAW